ncbi:hypothetical protein vseg_007450 [Gypsophila vaccaria]
MARKSHLQKQRELNLRGRSISLSGQADPPEDLKRHKEVDQGKTNPKNTTTGPTGENEGRMKDIHAIIGIPELVVESEDEEEEAITAKIMETGKQSINLANRASTSSDTLVSQEDEDEPTLQLELEDVQDEIEFWKNDVVCFILGANPPWEVVEGFVRRIWTKYNIDRISFLPNGIFLVRFHTEEMKAVVLQSGHYLFDNKPLIVKPWEMGMELKMEKVKTVPVWVQFQDLPLKFWGKSLPKIAGLIGQFIKTDSATQNKTKLGYARVLVEMEVEHRCPQVVAFKDENGETQRVGVKYEWFPITCTNCTGMGHRTEECRKSRSEKPQPKTRQIWRPVMKPPVVSNPPQEATKSPRQTVLPSPRAYTQNTSAVEQGGLNNGQFGAFSYREILSPTGPSTKENNGNASPLTNSHG